MTTFRAAVVALILVAACGSDPAAAPLPLDQCFPGVWQTNPIFDGCFGCGAEPTSECTAEDCAWTEILVLRADGVADQRELHLSAMQGHFSSARAYSTALRWELDGDEFVIDPGLASEGRYRVVSCFGTSVTVDAPWFPDTPRTWTRPTPDLVRAISQASESGAWTDVPYTP